MHEIGIKPKTDEDVEWVRNLTHDQWGSEIVLAHGEIFHPADLEGFVAWQGDERVGWVSFHQWEDACEIVTFSVLVPNLGIGGLLIKSVSDLCINKVCKRLWLITTNDNTHALRFYQKQGFRLCAIRPGAVNEARKIKPEIPILGEDGIPIRDEIELEMDF